MEDLIQSQNNPNWIIESSLVNDKKDERLRKLQWLWHCKLKQYMALVLMALTIGLAVVIIIAEISIFVPAVQKANPISLILQEN